MLTLTTQERIDLLSAYGSMLTDECRKHRLNPDLPFFATLTYLEERIREEVITLTNAIDDQRFDAVWGNKGIIAQCALTPIVHDAWSNICATGIDEGFDDLNPEEDAAMDCVPEVHLNPNFNPKGL